MKCQLGKVKSKLGGVTRTADFAPAYALDRSQPESSFQFPERPQHLSPYISLMSSSGGAASSQVEDGMEGSCSAEHVKAQCPRDGRRCCASRFDGSMRH